MAATTVLIVEDNPATSYVIARMLRARGIEVYEARCNLEALAFVKRQFPDVVLLDLRLGNETGYEICRNLREVDDTLRVVAMTGYEQETREKALEAGCSDFVRKPLASDELQRLLGG